MVMLSGASGPLVVLRIMRSMRRLLRLPRRDFSLVDTFFKTHSKRLRSSRNFDPLKNVLNGPLNGTIRIALAEFAEHYHHVSRYSANDTKG